MGLKPAKAPLAGPKAGNAQTSESHAGLYWLPGDAERHPSGEADVMQHLHAAGIPARKLVLGVPFYGRAWCSVDPKNNGLHQTAESYVQSYPYSVLVRDFIDKPGFIRRWDREAHVPYLWNPASGILISYEDPQSLKDKANFVRRHRLGGIMYWEHGEDPDEILLNALYYNLR